MSVAPQSIPDVEGFVRSLLRNVPGAVYRCDIDEAFTMRLLGDEMERITGYPARDFIANAHRTFESVIHPDDRAGVHRDVHEAISAGEPYALEYRIVTAAGEVRWILDRGLRACDATGRGCLDGIIFDITRRRLAEEVRLRAEAAASHPPPRPGAAGRGGGARAPRPRPPAPRGGGPRGGGAGPPRRRPGGASS